MGKKKKKEVGCKAACKGWRAEYLEELGAEVDADNVALGGGEENNN